MNRACELTEGKILFNMDLAYEGSPARIVNGLWVAGNKKTPLQNGVNNMLIILYLT